VTDPLQIYFRAATPADVAFLERLRRITMYRSVTNHSVWNDEVQRERVMANYDSARIVCASGQDIGLFKVVYSPTEVYLDQIQLLPAWQKKGIGTKLITMLQHECAAVNLPITLRVLRLNPALALYERLGFKITRSDTHLHTMYWTSRQNIASG